ncbi:DUF2254 domain-containing protein [Streptomyces sp. NPDC002851]
MRKRLRDSLLIVPLIGLLSGWLLASGAIQIDEFIYALDERWKDVDLRDLWFLRTARDLGAAAKTALGTMSAAMLTFIGVVFSISLVALQMAAGQFTPRVVRIYIESWVTKTTLAVFLCTFLYTLRAQKEYASAGDGKDAVVPYFGASLAMGLMVASLVLFVFYVNSTVRLMRVTHVMEWVTKESLHVITDTAARGHDSSEGAPAHACDISQATVLRHTADAGVLQAVHVDKLLRSAQRDDLVLHLVPKIGDYVCPGEPLFLACSGGAPPPRLPRSAVDFGVERTTEQDLGLGLRQLADIALRALSPAVNDPTTAVQALDRIQVLLTALARHPLGTLRHRDSNGTVRLVEPAPDWPEVLALALTEIRDYGADSTQVTRRLTALLDSLEQLAPAERRPAVAAQRALLAEAVTATQLPYSRQEFAMHTDRQGIG